VTDASTPADFAVFKEANPDLFPESIPEEQQQRVYAAMQVQKSEKKGIVSDGTVHVPSPHREWKITINAMRLQDQTSNALDALADINLPPFLFHRSRGLVRINYDEEGMPLIESLNEAALRGIIERCCQFQKMNAKGEEKPISPPLDVIKDIATLPDWNTIFPLTGIIECPCISLDNHLTVTQGYNLATRLYYAPAPGFTSPVIPDYPTKEDIKKSVELLQEIYINFPFIDQASRTNTIATLICAVIRPMIDGLVPMALFNKPQAGVGASLISKTIALVSTGKPASMITAPGDDEEWRKKITATLQNGRTIAIVDNIENKLFAPSLAALLTAEIWEDRVLGLSKNIALPNRMLWMGNGNNIMLGGDLPRRCYMIYLRADSARPWQRNESTFTHPHLLEWVYSNRTRIIAAILILTRGWILAGKPAPGESVPKMGGFEEWRLIIGGIVVFAELPDFLGNLEEMYQQADADSPQWELFFERWYLKWSDSPVTVKEIIDTLQKGCDSTQAHFGEEASLFGALPDFLLDAWNGKKSFPRVLGNRLAKMNNRMFVNGFQLKKGNVEHQAASWKICKHEKGELAK
jgi:hypothetical protein